MNKKPTITMTPKQYARMLASARGGGVTYGTVRSMKGCMCFLGHAVHAKKGTRPNEFTHTHTALEQLGLPPDVPERDRVWQVNDSYLFQLSLRRRAALAAGDPDEVQLWANYLKHARVLTVIGDPS